MYREGKNRKGVREGRWDAGGGREQGKERERHIRLGCRREKRKKNSLLAVLEAGGEATFLLESNTFCLR